MEKSLRNPPPGTRLIETMLWQPGRGVALATRHRDRLRLSAGKTGFPFDPIGFDAILETVSGDAPLRLRLTLDAAGALELETGPVPEPATGWRIAVAPDRLASGNGWLGVKSTNRGLYDRVRAALPDGIDEAVFLNEIGHICEGTITNLLIGDGRGGWLTPPLSDGVLPGVMRAELLGRGTARVASLSEADLFAAPRVRLCNALRGLIEVSDVVPWPESWPEPEPEAPGR